MSAEGSHDFDHDDLSDARSAHGHHRDGNDDQHAPDHDGHSHVIDASADRRYLTVSLVLIVGYMVGEVIAAALSGSLALLADAGHMLTDAASIAAAIAVSRIVERPPSGQWTFGMKRLEILSAASNGIAMLVVSALVLFEAIRRLINPPNVHGYTVLIVALAGVAVNLATTLILAKANRTNMNVQGAFKHLLADLYAFIGTAVAGIVILTTGFNRADPIASLVVVVLMLKTAWELLSASGHVLLEAAPKNVDIEEVRTHLLDLPEVTDIHDLHIWTVTSALPALSAHIVVRSECFIEGQAPQLLDKLQRCLAGHFDVEHSTFQLEPVGHAEHEHDVHY